MAMLLCEIATSLLVGPGSELLQRQRPLILGERVVQPSFAEQDDAAGGGDARVQQGMPREPRQDRLGQPQPLAGGANVVGAIRVRARQHRGGLDGDGVVARSLGGHHGIFEIATACLASTQVSNRCPSAYAVSASNGR